MHRLVVDTCVFVEGFLSIEETSSSTILAGLDKNNSRLVFSMEMIGELLYILKRECNKIGLDYDEANEILTAGVALFQTGKSINTRGVKCLAKANDPDDQMFIDAAFESDATHIITLDKKSGILGLTNVPFKCVTPDDYLKTECFVPVE